jgi:hypothetical protein
MHSDGNSPDGEWLTSPRLMMPTLRLLLLITGSLQLLHVMHRLCEVILLPATMDAFGHHIARHRRPAAKYKADRALFLMLLSAPYQSTRLSDRDGTRYNRTGRFWSTS